MADIPSLSTLQSQIENDIRTKFGITRPWIGLKIALRIIAMVQAARLKLIYLFISDVLKNLFVDTADSELNGGTLERFGRVKIGRNPLPARAGEYTMTVTGNIGGIIAKGIIFKSLQTATSPDKLYEVKNSITLSDISASVGIIALESGESAVLVIGDTIESTIPIANVDSKATIASVDILPVDAEDLETYRQIVMQSFQLEPQGGASTDYRLWSADAQGVRTVYAYTKNNASYTVQVFVEALPANSEPGQPKGVAPQAMLDEVTSVIEMDPDTSKTLNERGRRPLQAIVEVLSVIPVGVTIIIHDLSNKETATITAITNALNDLMYSIRPYIAGADGENKNDTIYVSSVIAAIYGAIDKSINFSAIDIKINNTVIPSFTFGNAPASYGNYPYLYQVLTP